MTTMPDTAGERTTEGAAPARSRHGLRAAARTVVPYAALVVTAVVLLGGAAQPLTNNDTFFHLRFGSEFLAGHWSLRHPGSVSTFATQQWVPTQWLPEVVMARVEDHWGLPGVAWLSGLQMGALLLALYLPARRWAEPLVVVPLVVLALLALGPWLSMRPQVLSYALVTITTVAWCRSRDDDRVRWWLVPLTWLWAMCHGMWPLGIVVGVTAVVGMALDRATTRRRLLLHLLVPVGSLVAAGLTPVGPALYGSLFAVGSRARFFSEWGAQDFTSTYGVPLVLLLGATLVLLARRRPAWTDLLLVLLAVGWAVYSSRTAPVAAVMLVPVVSRIAGRRTPPRPALGRREVVAVVGGVAACLVALAAVVPHTADRAPEESFAVSRALDALPAGTPVLNSWTPGGFLMWRHPQLDLVMHGYGDTFTTAELQRNTSIEELDPGWNDLVRGTRARWAVVSPGSRLAYALHTLEGWDLVAPGTDLEVLRAPSDW